MKKHLLTILTALSILLLICCQSNPSGNQNSMATMLLEDPGQAWMKINDSKAASDSNFVAGVELQREGKRKGQIGYPDVMDNNLHFSNYASNGSIEFQTEGTTKVAITADGWLQSHSGLWLSPSVPLFENSKLARVAGLVDGQTFVRKSDGALIVLIEGIN